MRLDTPVALSRWIVALLVSPGSKRAAITRRRRALCLD
jgi:hypothetical protein